LSLRTKLSFNFLKWYFTHFQAYFSIHRIVLLKNCFLLSNHSIFVLNYIFMFIESFSTSFQIILHQLWSLLAFEVIDCSRILNCVTAMFYCVLLLCCASYCNVVIFEHHYFEHQNFSAFKFFNVIISSTLLSASFLVLHSHCNVATIEQATSLFF
jgi:hypothetical protein